MTLILAALRELFGLFVDDGNYALIILLWLLGAGLSLPLIISPEWCAPILCLGLLAILVENTLRSARQK